MAHSHAQRECLWQLLFVVKNFYDFLISKKSLLTNRVCSLLQTLARGLRLKKPDNITARNRSVPLLLQLNG